MSLREYLDHWLAGMKPQLASTGWSSDERVLRLYLPDTLGRTSLSDPTGSALTDHYAVLVERGGRSRPTAALGCPQLHRR